MLLAIDTSAGTSLALVSEHGELIAQAETADTMRHAEAIGSFLAQLRPAERGVNGVVVGVGPGPFTGLRVGIAAARGYAWGSQLPMLPVLSHDAAALAAYRATAEPAQTSLTISTDARRREYFCTRYLGLVDGVPVRAGGPEISAEPGGELSASIHAADLALVAIARRAAGLPLDAAEAVYLRSPDVTLRPTVTR